jgi:ATP/maltotriose-dependent transcriptional regulator MalT
VRLFVPSAGIDDDFPLFWTTAINDQLAVGDVTTARQMLDHVSTAPWGHVTLLLRAMLPWMKARVAVAAGDDDESDAPYIASTDALRDFGAPFFLAQALLDHASWLEARGRVEDAQLRLEEARALLVGLGATPWLARAGGDAADLVDAATS